MPDLRHISGMIHYPTAILLDWDSTLVDSWGGIVEAWNHALTQLGREPTMTRARAIFLSSKPHLESFLEVFDDEAQRGGSLLYEYLRAQGTGGMSVLPGSEDLLKGLTALGIPLAVVSNKNGVSLADEVAHLGWSPYFFATVGAGDAAYDKPHPAPILYALEQRMIAPGPDVWMVGDMHSDMEAAGRAGVTAVLMETSIGAGLISEASFRDHKPHLRVKNAKALLDLVNGLKRPI